MFILAFVAVLCSAFEPSCAPDFSCAYDAQCHQVAVVSAPSYLAAALGYGVKCLNNSCVVLTAGSVGLPCSDATACPVGTACVGSPRICRALLAPGCACDSSTDDECRGVCVNGVCAISHALADGQACIMDGQCQKTSSCASSVCTSKCLGGCDASQVCDLSTSPPVCVTNCQSSQYLDAGSKVCKPRLGQGATCNASRSCEEGLGCIEQVCSKLPSAAISIGSVCRVVTVSSTGGSVSYTQTQMLGPCVVGAFCSSNTNRCEATDGQLGSSCSGESCSGSLVCAHPPGSAGAPTCQPSTEGMACDNSTMCNNNALQCTCQSDTSSVCKAPVTTSSVLGLTVAMTYCANLAGLTTSSTCVQSFSTALAEQDVTSMNALSAECKAAAATLYCCIRCRDTINFLGEGWPMLAGDLMSLSCSPPSIVMSQGGPTCGTAIPALASQPLTWCTQTTAAPLSTPNPATGPHTPPSSPATALAPALSFLLCFLFLFAVTL